MTRSEPELSVVVCAGPLERPGPELVARRGGGVEAILVAEGGGAQPDEAFDRVLDVYPAGAGYARNRGLALASAPNVAFVDVVGPRSGWVFPREALVAAGGFDLSLGPLLGSAFDADAVLRLARAGTAVRVDERLAARSAAGAFAAGAGLGRLARRHRTLAVARTLRGVPALAGFVAGALRRPSRDAPALDLGLVPDALRPHLGARPLEPLALRHKAKTQHLYRLGEDAILHVHLDPTPRLLRSLAEREAIRMRSSAGGIPRVLASAEGLDSLWVLEDLLPGRAPDARDVETWFPRVSDWAVAVAHPTGPPLRESDRWTEHRAELGGAAREDLREPVERAARVLEALPSVPMHGDLQRANLLLSADGVGAVDWEGAWLHGIPGLDLVFLALLAGDAPPDPEIVREIAAGRRLRPELERVGVGPDLVVEALLVYLASWSASERGRLARLGAPPREPVFGPLFEEVGPALAGQASSAGRRTTAGRLR
jgi:hypothetical protein